MKNYKQKNCLNWLKSKSLGENFFIKLGEKVIMHYVNASLRLMKNVQQVWENQL